MGAVYIAMGDFASAVQCHEQHLDIAKAQGEKREEARAYSNLGSAYHYRRDFDKAASYHARVLELAQELQEHAIEMRAYAGLGHAARCMQDLERAKQYHEQQLSIAEGLKDRAAEGRASSNLGKQKQEESGSESLIFYLLFFLVALMHPVQFIMVTSDNNILYIQVVVLLSYPIAEVLVHAQPLHTQTLSRSNYCTSFHTCFLCELY